MNDSIPARLRALWTTKLALMVILNAWVCLPYFLLQHHPVFPITYVESGFLDRFVPFQDMTVFLYQSIYLFMPVAPMLMSRSCDLRRYALGIAGISLCANFVFLLFPTAIIRPASEGTTLLYQWLTHFDGIGNAFPSLHAAFALYSMLCLGPVLRELHLRGHFAFFTWGVLILYSTLATKQHAAIDLFGGAVLAVAAYAIAFGIHPIRMNFSTRPSEIPNPSKPINYEIIHH